MGRPTWGISLFGLAGLWVTLGFWGFLFWHLGAVCVSHSTVVGELAPGPPWFSWVPSLYYLTYEKKTMCVVSSSPLLCVPLCVILLIIVLL